MNGADAPQLAAYEGLQVAHEMPAQPRHQSPAEMPGNMGRHGQYGSPPTHPTSPVHYGQQAQQPPAGAYQQAYYDKARPTTPGCPSPVSQYAPASQMGAATSSHGIMGHPPPSKGAYPDSHAYEKSFAGDSRRRTVPWGLNPWVFALIAALLGMIISGAIVGGVLGSQLNNQSSTAVVPANNSTASSSPEAATTSAPADDPPPPPVETETAATGTTTSSSARAQPTLAPLDNYSVAPARTIERLANDCPRLDGQRVTAFQNTRFAIECKRDSQGQGREAPGAVSVIVAQMAYSLDDCLNACASMNQRSGAAGRGLRCRLAVWHPRMDQNLNGNCYLKNATRAENNNGISHDSAITASLVT